MDRQNKDQWHHRISNELQMVLKMPEIWVYSRKTMELTDYGYRLFLKAGILFQKVTISLPKRPCTRFLLGLTKIPAPYYFPKKSNQLYIADPELATYLALIDGNMEMLVEGFLNNEDIS